MVAFTGTALSGCAKPAYSGGAVVGVGGDMLARESEIEGMIWDEEERR